MTFLDTLALSWRTVRANKLRTGITVAIIALGITALIGIVTAIEAMNQKLTESFSTLGATGFTIRFKQGPSGGGGGGGGDLKVHRKGARREKRSNQGKPITLDEAETFLQRFTFPGATAGLSAAGGSHQLAYQSRRTSPNVRLNGVDEQYLILNGFKLQAGRNFTTGEVRSASSVCLLGYDVANKLFPRNADRAVGRTVLLDNRPYRVLGVLESRGSTLGFSRDNMALIGYRNQARYSRPETYSLAVMTNDLQEVEAAMGEAEGIFRGVRRLSTTEDSNFKMDRSDSVAQTAMNSLQFLTVSVLIIGLITLVGAAIGLMNIMLVAVTERTKEVGLIKAIGGRRGAVQRQFLLEALIISVGGALLGILFGIGIGNLFSMVLSTGFVVPWAWIGYGIGLCMITGLVAGSYPALKAGRLNPIEALRYE